VSWTQVEAYVGDNAGPDDLDIPTFPRELSTVDYRRIRHVRIGALVLLLTLVAAGATGLLGVRGDTVSVAANGYELSIEHPWITRGGMDADWSLQVRRRGGFSRPITIAYTRDYLDLFQVDDVFPQPIAQISSPPYLYLVFATPPSDILDVAFPAHAVPSVRSSGRHVTEVSVLADGKQVIHTSYATWLVP
jgi:hypothetical protein